MERLDARDLWLEDAMAQWEVPLLRTCYLLLRDPALAEDAVQMTFVKAWRAFDHYRRDAAEKTWLMRIAVNVCHDLTRTRWFRHVDRSVSTDDLPEASEPFSLPDDTVTRAVLSLPDALRQVVTLRFFQGMTIEETAAVMKLSPRTIHNRLDKAKRLLQSSLEEWYHDE